MTYEFYRQYISWSMFWFMTGWSLSWLVSGFVWCKSMMKFIKTIVEESTWTEDNMVHIPKSVFRDKGWKP